MKKFTIALASAAALLAGPALAADLAVRPIAKAPAYVPVPIASNWSGFYFGGSVGGMWESVRGNMYNAGPTFGWNTDRSTGVGGVHGGLQWQTGMFVLGAEAGWLGTWGGWGTTAGDAGAAPFNCGGAVGNSCQSRVSNIWYVGPKLGLAFDRFMIYGQGGYASAELHTRGIATATGVVLAPEISANHGGWYAGAGVDVMAWNLGGTDVILGIDYKHFEFDAVNHVDVATPVNSRRVDADADVVTARLTFKFNPWRGPIAASY